MTDKQTYITKTGLEELKEELEKLKTEKREEIAERISQAKELGDLSENAEYSEAKEAQAFNEGRILELETVLKNAIIIDEDSSSAGVVVVGSKVAIKEKNSDKEREYHIVGSHEASPAEGRISNESPIGKALLGGKVGDLVKIELPKGIVEWEITDIR